MALHCLVIDYRPGDDDICYATSNRQAAIVEVARHSELVLVPGSPNSSNPHRLAEGGGGSRMRRQRTGNFLL